jgi:hypothetical protein
MMQVNADFDDDLEKTQNLPSLKTGAQREEISQREHADKNEIAKLTRKNLQQAREIVHLRNEQKKCSQPTELDLLTEARFFEVCGGLKDALAKVLDECRRRSVKLDCAGTAHHVLDNCCDELERILSAPEVAPPAFVQIDRRRRSALRPPHIRNRRLPPQALAGVAKHSG